MSRGKIFVSSTIYDFRDLRSSLKYWLNEAGYEVLMSEHSDFQKDVSQNSFDACLNSIKDCDYFILLIGGRVGGLYDNKENVSITQKEYRTAYEYAKKGTIKIIIFVRKEIWNIKEDRKSIEKYLAAENKIDNEIIEKVLYSSSKFVKDAKFIFSFIDEVSRKNEMRITQNYDVGRPINNWVHTFDNFEEIISVLSYSLELNISFDKKIAISNVVREIGVNLSYLFYKNTSNITAKFKIFPRNEITCEYINFKVKGEFLDKIQTFLAISQTNYGNMSVKYIEHTLNNGVFFEYDKESGSFIPNRIHNALIKIYDEILFFMKVEQVVHDNFTKINDRISGYKRNRFDSQAEYTLDIEFFPVVSLHDRMSNIFELAKYVFSIIEREDQEIAFPKLYEKSPLNVEYEKNLLGDVQFEELIAKFFLDNTFLNKLFK